MVPCLYNLPFLGFWFEQKKTCSRACLWHHWDLETYDVTLSSLFLSCFQWKWEKTFLSCFWRHHKTWKVFPHFDWKQDRSGLASTQSHSCAIIACHTLITIACVSKSERCCSQAHRSLNISRTEHYKGAEPLQLDTEVNWVVSCLKLISLCSFLCVFIP